METLTSTPPLTPDDVERAAKRDQKRYELIDGKLKEKEVGFVALFVATRIAERLNAKFYPQAGAAAVEAMIYCFKKRNHGRKPDVVYVSNQRFAVGEMPEGDLFVAPNLVVEVLSPSNTGIELEQKLDEYLEAGVEIVWIVNPESRTIRIYRQDGTTKLFRAIDTIEGESALPGFSLKVSEIFPLQRAATNS